MEIEKLKTLEDLFFNRRFFDLRDELEKFSNDNSPELLFYCGAVANKFNRMRESIDFLLEYLDSFKPKGEKLRFCYELLGDNYAKSYEYANAAQTFRLILDKFSNEFDEAEKQNAEYLFNLWSAASNVPPQKISFASETHIQGKRGKLQHLLIPIEINGHEIDFIFDTGADVTSISVSNAEKLGLQIVETNINVSGVSCRSDAKFAVAPKIKFGNITIENVVMIVIEDKDFYLAKHDYQIDGVLGYLAIAACRQIVINQKDEIIIPVNVVHNECSQNLCMDEMKPIFKVSVDEHPMTFFFDTGGSKTKFFPKFLKSQETAVKKTGKLQTGSLTGVGGTKDYPAYLAAELSFSVSGKVLNFKDSMIFTVPTIYQSEFHYGNLGQDWITQYNKMTLDFTNMSLILE